MNDELFGPTIRLAASPVGEKSGANSVRHHVGECGLGGPTVRLAHVDGAQGDGALAGKEGNGPLMLTGLAPALLVSYYYLEPFERNKHLYRYRDWVLDSGAFSAHNSGASINLSRYVDKCLELLQSDPTLTEVFSLDVIPKDHQPATVQRAAEQSLKNCEEMWRQGVPAIPTFHRGEDESFLYAMAKDYPKIAIGGVALLRGDQKFAFCQQVFARVWPKKIHGLGMASEELVYGLPFHSVDATNWEIAPCAFGNWQKFGSMSVRGSNQDLRSQVKYYLDMEAKAQVRWAKEMSVLGTLAVRLVANGQDFGDGDTRRLRAFGKPTVRLAIDAGSASGERVAGAIGAPSIRLACADPSTDGRDGARTARAVSNAPAEKKVTGKLDDKWIDYWKNRI